jgi:Tfp pilus assembly protein PilX
MKHIKLKNQSGQTLVTLIIIVVMTLVVSTALVVLVINNSKSSSRISQSIQALATAESGAENAILKLLRDPTYSGETMTFGEHTAVVTVHDNGNKVITSEGTAGNFKKTIRVEISFIGGVLEVISWNEV